MRVESTADVARRSKNSGETNCVPLSGPPYPAPKTPSAAGHIYQIDGHGWGLQGPNETSLYLRSALNIRESVSVQLYGMWFQASNYLRWHSTWALKPKADQPQYTRDAANLQTLGDGWTKIAIPW